MRGVVKSVGYNCGPAQCETRPPVSFLSYPLLAREQTGYRIPGWLRDVKGKRVKKRGVLHTKRPGRRRVSTIYILYTHIQYTNERTKRERAINRTTTVYNTR